MAESAYTTRTSSSAMTSVRMILIMRFRRTPTTRVSDGDDMTISDAVSSFHEKKNRVFSPLPRAGTMSSYSYHSSERFRTPSPSNYSVTPSVRESMYREEFGREINTYCDVYRLPADEEEIDRLEKQHNMFIDIFGAKYPPPMGVALRQGHYEPTKKVLEQLELGCGSGGWIKDACRDFPYCDAIAVDLVPLSEDDDFPSNLRMEIDNLNKGIEHFYDQFDVVHSRLIAFGIRHYHRLVEHVARVLRPNGLIEAQEYDFQTYDRDHKIIPANPTDPLRTYPWWATFLAHLREAVIAAGGDTTAATNLEGWIQGHDAFDNVVYKDVWLPVIPGKLELQAISRKRVHEDERRYLGFPSFIEASDHGCVSLQPITSATTRLTSFWMQHAGVGNTPMPGEHEVQDDTASPHTGNSRIIAFDALNYNWLLESVCQWDARAAVWMEAPRIRGSSVYISGKLEPPTADDDGSEERVQQSWDPEADTHLPQQWSAPVVVRPEWSHLRRHQLLLPLLSKFEMSNQIVSWSKSNKASSKAFNLTETVQFPVRRGRGSRFTPPGPCFSSTTTTP
ncbi:hypothetical protein D9611_001724 [Ephemerocybe angulata]|uniref:Methyltransferase domain-containing protein n=1 Tax=Ephemerocybe angulata TaxID=980116 RepID=A0A8H5FM45_9AGAR|nr:hypothetical protein D9611_001724 [Tulosesus angulatus]